MEAFFDLSLPKSWADLYDPHLLFFFRELATDKPLAEIQMLCLCQWANVLVRCRLYGSVYLVQHGKQQATLTLHQFVCAITALDHLKSFPPYPIRIRTFGKVRAIADDSHHQTIPLLLNAFYWFSSLKHYFARLFPHFLQPMSSWAQRCDGCPLRGQCFKGKGNRTINVNHQLRRYKKKAFERFTSERGLFHRSKRPVEPEAVFGQIKTDKQYKRFRHRGFPKIQMDFGILAMAFNLQKLIKNVGKDQIKAVKEDFSALFGLLLASLWTLWGKFQKEETSVNKNRQLSNRNLTAA